MYWHENDAKGTRIVLNPWRSSAVCYDSAPFFATHANVGRFQRRTGNVKVTP